MSEIKPKLTQSVMEEVTQTVPSIEARSTAPTVSYESSVEGTKVLEDLEGKKRFIAALSGNHVPLAELASYYFKDIKYGTDRRWYEYVRDSEEWKVTAASVVRTKIGRELTKLMMEACNDGDPVRTKAIARTIRNLEDVRNLKGVMEHLRGIKMTEEYEKKV